MIHYQYEPGNAHIDQRVQALLPALSDELHRVYAQRNTPAAYTELLGCVNAPDDTAAYAAIMQCVVRVRAQPIDMLVIVGIGGSNLGARAVYEALVHCIPQSPPVLFADTVDPRAGAGMYQTIEAALHAGKRVVTVLVSKTGTTLETVVHSDMIISLLKQYRAQQYPNDVVVISDERSPFAAWAKQVGCAWLMVPRVIEGRFTLFTPVGLAPLALLGIDIEQLRHGAQQVMVELTTKEITQSPVIQNASAIFTQYLAGNYLLDFFVFASPLLEIGGWYRQLIGESLGKTYQIGQLPSLVPLVSRASNDLHSVLQLYVGDRMPCYTQFVTLEQWPADVTVAQQASVPGAGRYAGKSFAGLMYILFESTRRAYQKQGKPYQHIAFQTLSPATLGYFLQVNMVQTFVLGRLFGINPFDQPHVELYKKEARILLGD